MLYFCISYLQVKQAGERATEELSKAAAPTHTLLHPGRHVSYFVFSYFVPLCISDQWPLLEVWRSAASNEVA